MEHAHPPEDGRVIEVMDKIDELHLTRSDGETWRGRIHCAAALREVAPSRRPIRARSGMEKWRIARGRCQTERGEPTDIMRLDAVDHRDEAGAVFQALQMVLPGGALGRVQPGTVTGQKPAIRVHHGVRIAPA